VQITVIEDTEEEKAEKSALALRQEVEALQVVDQESYNLANSINKKAYEGKKSFHDWFDPIDEASKRQRQAVIAQGKKIDEPFDFAIKVTGKKAADWMAAERAKAAEAKRKAEAEARKAAEEAALAAAQALQEQGMGAAAEAVLEQPVVIPKIVVETPIADEGTFIRTNYSAEGVDLLTLVKAIAGGEAALNAVQFNQDYLNGWARTSKGTESMPGVRVITENSQGRR